MCTVFIFLSVWLRFLLRAPEFRQPCNSRGFFLSESNQLVCSKHLNQIKYFCNGLSMIKFKLFQNENWWEIIWVWTFNHNFNQQLIQLQCIRVTIKCCSEYICWHRFWFVLLPNDYKLGNFVSREFPAGRHWGRENIRGQNNIQGVKIMRGASLSRRRTLSAATRRSWASSPGLPPSSLMAPGFVAAPLYPGKEN